jgi:O-antigen ligase
LEIAFDYGFVGMTIYLCWAFFILAILFKRSSRGGETISTLAGASFAYRFIFNNFVSWFPSQHFNFALFSIVTASVLAFIIPSVKDDREKNRASQPKLGARNAG